MTGKILTFQSMWGMSGLPSKKTEWSLNQKLERIREAGFDGIDIDYPYVLGKESYWKDLTQKYNLRLAVQGPLISDPQKLKEALTVAQKVDSPYFETQAGNSFMVESEAKELLQSLYQVAKTFSIPLFIQTHRGSLTQDILRTAQYCADVSELRINLDVSHYFLGGEWTQGANDRAWKALDPILEKTGMIDGRISNGEQIQVGFKNGESIEVTYFKKIWTAALNKWRSGALSKDPFIFRAELGPPPYALTDEKQNELTDRWSEAIGLLHLIKTL